MRLCSSVRLVFAAALALALFTGMTVVSAQDATAEVPEDPMMTQMMMMEGACPKGAAAAVFAQMSMELELGTTGTEEPLLQADADLGLTATEDVMGVKCLFGEFSDSAEVPGPGDDDGWGVVFVSIDPVSGDVCYEMAVANITLPAAATHIHVNPAGLSGDVVVPFPTAPDAEGEASGCINANVEGLAGAIASTPETYYVNVHTSDFPDGAVRAQLSAWDESTTPIPAAG